MDSTAKASSARDIEEGFSSDNEASRRREKSGSSTGGKDAGPNSTNAQDRERKIGHRRVDDTGQVSYKKIHVNQLMQSIQLGIQQSIGSMSRYDERDLLMQDFMTVDTVTFPKNGSHNTPAHPFSDFTFRTYAPLAFRYFLNLFGIRREDFLLSLCNEPMRELSNPGASGSIFYLTNDDEFILKTVQHKESEFLQKLLPGYYMNLNQNPHTLLPKFFGMYCYQCNQKNIRLTVMNNLLPSNVKMHLKYDLKGSTYKRKASKSERAKSSPVYKDLDFMEMLPEGLLLEPETYNALISTLRRDCRVLESFRIMDYSLLVGIHNLDQAARDEAERAGNASPNKEVRNNYIRNFTKQTSQQRKRLLAHSTALESIQAQVEPIDEQEHLPPGGIPARNHKGERLLLFLGIIDILQSYRMRKKLEHTLKAIVLDGDTVSVHRPGFYAHRFLDFMADKVFKKIPSLDMPEITGSHRKFRTLVSSIIGVGQQYNIAMKHSPSRKGKKDSIKKMSTTSAPDEATEHTSSQQKADDKDANKSGSSSSGVRQRQGATTSTGAETAEGERQHDDINLPAVLWDRPPNKSGNNNGKRPSLLRSPTADACNAAIAAAFSPHKQVTTVASSSSSTTTTSGASTTTVVQRGAEVNYFYQHSSSQPDIVLGHTADTGRSRAKFKLHEQVKQVTTERTERRSDSRTSSEEHHHQQHNTPSKISLGAGSSLGGKTTPTWTEGTPSFTESTNSAAGNTPSRRSIGTSRDSVVTRNYRDTPYHETEITRL